MEIEENDKNEAVIYRGEIVAYINKENNKIKIINKKMFIQMKTDPDDVNKYKDTSPRKYKAKTYGTVDHPKKYRLGTKNYMKKLGKD